MQHKVIESTYRILGEAERPLLLHRTSQPCEGETTTPRPNSCWFPRDRDDRADDLWTVWNVVQENAIKGGLRGVGRDDLGRPRRVKSRAVNGIDQDIKLNKALWLLGERMAALKS